MIKRTYECDLCGNTRQADELVGIVWTATIITEAPAHQTERHLCFNCLSGLQTMTPVCGQGYKCKGGPTCSSDHK